MGDPIGRLSSSPPTDLLTASGAPESEGARVLLRDLLESQEFGSPAWVLPVAVGMDSDAHPLVLDLARLQHVLVAGGPRSGKSVVLNAMLLSLLYRHSPATLRLLLIDTKQLELGPYGSLPHLIYPVITDVPCACAAVTWLDQELRRRTSVLASTHSRSIAEHNARAHAGDGRAEPLPYLVVALDDLLEPALDPALGEAFVGTLGSVLAAARPVGVHVIAVTHHPSASVLQEVVPRAFPCRVGLWLHEAGDRYSIMDDGDYEPPSGIGGVVVVHPTTPQPLRAQSPFVSAEDVDRVVVWHQRNSLPSADPGLARRGIDAALRRIAPQQPGVNPEKGERDPLFWQAAEICIWSQLGSTSLLQRRMSIGYGRAARLIDALEAAGVLGPMQGSKPRDVLVGLDALDGLPSDAGRQVTSQGRGAGCAGQVGTFVLGAVALSLLLC